MSNASLNGRADLDVEPDGPAAATVHGHEFRPRGEWWSLCETCGLARAAHSRPGPPPPPPPLPPPADPAPGGHGAGPEPDLPIGTGTEIDLLDAQALLPCPERETTDDG